MVKQYIRKRRFTKVIFVLGLFQLYIWITFKYLIEIMDIKCYCENRNYEVNFEKLEKTYYISSICSFVLKMILLLLFLICCISYQMIENKYLFLMMFAETLPIFISIILFLCDKVLGIKTERIEYKFEKNSLL